MSSGDVRLLDAGQVRDHLDPTELVAALRTAFSDPGTTVVPDRVTMPLDESVGTSLLLKPAWRRDGLLGVKVTTHHPDNGRRGLPAIHALYAVHDAATGAPLAVLDGTELTRWRTAAASALAADLLAPRRVREHLLVGSGNVSAALPACYATVRDVALTRVWARRHEQAESLARQLREEGVAAEAVAPGVEALREAVRRADVVSCATSATSPLVLGEDVGPGTHVDLIGSFTPGMVEADEALVTRARVFVDIEAAVHESGDLAGPVARGALRASDILGTLADLASGRRPGREHDDEVTVFKSVGTSLEDLVAAEVVLRRAGGGDDEPA
ncbi:ornithine cyclodeaminase family protein [Ornithinimicrobium flavum]|uniref:ornithine cyclodeaminase family protein n=1 Tax=Ornithinimicrobium flavum TaxID=1288636 RepID=UPI00107030E5|nr:ornithine cyclodeaminase family protein [Ornithinimicrobium flavum]